MKGGTSQEEAEDVTQRVAEDGGPQTARGGTDVGPDGQPCLWI